METTNNPDIYVPKGATTLDKSTVDPQIRLGIQGSPGGGKTNAALTFPNPVVMNMDRGLGAHRDRSDVIDVPFFDSKFINSICPSTGVPLRKDAIVKWLTTEAIKLTPAQTLIVDSTSQLENYYHAWYAQNREISERGKEDKYAQWRLKLDFFGEVYEYLKELKCNVVSISHETVDRDDTGAVSGVKPLITGAYADKIGAQCTDWFRAIVIAKPLTDSEKANVLAKYCDGSDELYREFLASTPKEHKAIYLWQTVGDNVFKAKSSTVTNLPKFIVANYSSFDKYKKKQTPKQ